MEASPRADTAAPPHDTPSWLATIIEQVYRETSHWWGELSVSIGQAKMLTGLKDSQIRYYEELEALRPRKTSAQSGASRLFTMAELRRLQVLARLNQEGLRVAEAAELVRTHGDAIDIGVRRPIAEIIGEERGVVADGFMITRLISQLLAAVQAECNEHTAATVEVRGAIFPLRRIFTTNEPDEAAVREVGDELLRAPAGMLVALVQGSDPAQLTNISPALHATGNDEQTVLFYSPDPHTLGLDQHYCYSAYVPTAAPDHAMLFFFACTANEALPCLMRAAEMHPARVKLLDALLDLCATIAPDFCRTTLTKNYRYRSDGFPLTLTGETTAELLCTIRRVLLPADDGARVVLLVPDSLDAPTSLAILSHCGYDDGLARRARLDLRGEDGQGLSGRAYKLREPFLSLRADQDARVAFALEEGCRQALALPLATSWGLSPFGVLYIATEQTEHGLDSQKAYVALVLAGILSELLGRWWLTRLRRDLDQTQHRSLQSIVGWFDSLDEQGPSFQAGLQAIYDLVPKSGAKLKNPALADGVVVLAVLDIDYYRHTVQVHSNEPLPLHAQRHVSAAIQRVKPGLASYWFKNDHALLCLTDHDQAQADELLHRIVDQVALTPLQIPGQRDRLRIITVSAAYKMISYQALCDLGQLEQEQFKHQISTIVRQLCFATRRGETSKVVALDAGAERGLTVVGK